jgi:hypothetical protein
VPEPLPSVRRIGNDRGRRNNYRPCRADDDYRPRRHDKDVMMPVVPVVVVRYVFVRDGRTCKNTRDSQDRTDK